MKHNLIELLREQIIDYNRYENGEIKVIGYPGYKHSDCTVKDKMSYAEWIETYTTYPVIKVEGLETILVLKEKYNPTNIHLFVNQKPGISFNWHKDNVKVLLEVIKGQKIVWIKNKKIVLCPKNHVIIPKGHLHRAFSRRGTWALSVGY